MHADNGGVGELVFLSRWRADRSRPRVDGARFFFALDCPLSYLAAERVERALGAIEWVPVMGPLSEPDRPATPAERAQRARDWMRLAEREARILEIPLVAPHRFPMNSRKAARAAAFAVEAGAGPGFALAVARMAFCGGFDVASETVIEEAAASAGLDPAEALAAANDDGYDLSLDATSRGLRARGIASPPAINLGHSWFDGPDAVIAALTFSSVRAQSQAPPAPAS